MPIKIKVYVIQDESKPRMTIIDFKENNKCNVMNSQCITLNIIPK